MIITDMNANEINEAWLREALKSEARRTGIKVFNPRPDIFRIEMDGRTFHLEIQDYTAELADDETGDTILAAVSEGDDFEDDLARAVIHRIIQCF